MHPETAAAIARQRMQERLDDAERHRLRRRKDGATRTRRHVNY
jgi:hypothetical protein